MSKTRAFSLVELLVVLVIIGMLTALLFPVFAVSRKRAIQTQCLSNLRQVGVAVHLYESDNNDLLPPHNPYRWIEDGGVQPSPNQPAPALPGSGLEAYGAGRAVASCPTSRYAADLGGYEWRFEIYLRRNGLMTKEAYWQSVRPQPESVLAYCFRHLTRGFVNEQGRESYISGPANHEGNFVALRGDGSAEFVPAGEVGEWQYLWNKGHPTWLPPDAPAASKVGEPFDVFRGEPWPPQFVEGGGKSR